MKDDVSQARHCQARDWEHWVRAIRRNIGLANALFGERQAENGQLGRPAGVIGTVSGSAPAAAFWQHKLDASRENFKARTAISFHEDLPVNQAFGLLLLWHRLKPKLQDQEGALIAFVFGEGTRATPFTEAEGGQKPAISSFATSSKDGRRRFLSTVELAMRAFAPVEAFLRRSGFDGIVVKWGDEVQIPTRDLCGECELFRGADIVRFVSMMQMDEQNAANKDWVGVDESGTITAFIPRRPLAQMAPLAKRGLLQTRDGVLYGGVNLGSIALSRALLDVLWREFEADVLDPTADRKKRPDLDPQLFTALTIARIEDSAARQAAWQSALEQSEAMRELQANMPDVLDRLSRALARFAAEQGRAAKMVALDFEDQYWGDIGQHEQMYELYMSLNEPGARGDIARELAGIGGVDRDARGNLIVGESELGQAVRAENAVLIDTRVERGEIVDSVLIGSCCQKLTAHAAFDIQSRVPELTLAPRAGSYKVVSEKAVNAAAGERITTVVFEKSGPSTRSGESSGPNDIGRGNIEMQLMRVHETTDLRDKAKNYEAPIMGNPLSFGEAHRRVIRSDPATLQLLRRR
jgi:hypothetical protein